MDFENFKIIDKHNNKRRLGILEVLHIKTNDNINKREDCNKMGNLYDYIISNIKKSKNRNHTLKPL